MPTSEESTEAATPQRESWVLLRIVCAAEQSELIADHLWTLGVQAVEETMLGDGRVELRTHVGDDRELETALMDRFGDVVVSRVEVPVRVADTWRAHARPTEIDAGLWLCPAWVEPRPPGHVVLVEPGATFGLGDHPTTVLALRLALAACAPGERIHDHGAGSGVLAVALSAWRGARVSVDDIAPDSFGVAAANAGLNGVDAPEWCAELPPVGSELDGVVANILAPVLRDHSCAIQDAVRVGGWIVLSGMRADQLDAVLAHYRACSVTTSETREGWSAVLLRKVADRAGQEI